jgi:hypothetical protein
VHSSSGNAFGCRHKPVLVARELCSDARDFLDQAPVAEMGFCSAALWGRVS